MNYPVGSTWKKWDLHVHTPDSLVHFYDGNDQNLRWEKFITDLESLPPEFKVIGINDYLFLDGYRKVLDYKKKGRLINIDLILPVLEFRIEKFAGHREFKRINFHVIFSDELTPDIIQAQFINGLQGQYKLEPGLDGVVWSGLITPESLTDLGQKIKATVPSEKLGEYGSDIEEGFRNLNLDEKSIIRLLRENSYLKGKTLTAIGKTEWDALAWNDNSIAVKKDIISKVDFVFTSAESIQKYQSARQKLIEQKVNDLLLDCSDAHYNSSSRQKDRIGKCYSWIKADTTFQGLRQLLNEPERLYVGDEPPLLTRVRNNPTKFIKNLSIEKIQGTLVHEKWFENFQIEVNPGLVAIIGNKGNGKSAITDIIALTGNSHNESYSFLTKRKFRSTKQFNRAIYFKSTLTWQSDIKESKSLNDSIDLNQPQKVKYIPQNFLENLCVTEDEEVFEEEIKKIIFSRLSSSQRLGKTNLDEIILFRTEQLKKEEAKIRSRNDSLNDKIIALEEKANPDFKEALKNQLSVRNAELESLEKNKPVEVKPPQEDPDVHERNKVTAEEIENLIKKQNDLDQLISSVSNEDAILAREIIELDNSIQAFRNLESEVTATISDQQETLSKFGILVSDLLTFKINLEPISFMKLKKETIRQEIQTRLNNSGEKKGLLLQSSEIASQILILQTKLSEPQQVYSKYLNEITTWTIRKTNIIGTKEKEGTIQNLKSQIEYVENSLNSDLETLKEERKGITLALIKKKNEIIAIYRDLYHPVSDFIQNYGDMMRDYKINIDVALVLEGFVEKFFDQINQGVKGSFLGIESGQKILKEIIEKYDLSTDDNILQLLNEVLEYLNTDKRVEPSEIRSIQDQLKKGYTKKEFYNFLFGLEYLRPLFKLKLGEKNLTELSQGERGALLLIFYLFLDFEDIPLIIDQPEENLDNESVYLYLVHFIKEAKERRQIVIVTHNPNLAVVCDAEQVIQMSIAKEKFNEVTCISGAIENPEINKRVVNVLEGTRPAFDNRTSKYESVRKS